uniref:Alkyl transferase n=1 Tax=Strigamia maritima TaxID=126957 RepID=T1IIK3_STRMM
MNWCQEEKLSWLQWFCVKVLKAGEIPHHVAFIMDGNRRFAKKVNVEISEGHRSGFDNMIKTYNMCEIFGIDEVSVYAFSIENFKRSKDEVDALMEIFRVEIDKLKSDKDEIMKNNMCFRFIGNLELLPQDVQILMSEVSEMTKENTGRILNIFAAYTSREEIARAIREVANGVERGWLKSSDVNQTLLENCLYTNKCKPIDLVVRTSGEVRLSDFCCGKVRTQCLFLLKRSGRNMDFGTYKENGITAKEKIETEEIYENANKQYREMNNHNPRLPDAQKNKQIQLLINAREDRVTSFLRYLEEKRSKNSLTKI